MKSLLDMLGLGNSQQNAYKIINRIIPKEEYKSKHKVLRNKQHFNLQIFYNYIDNFEDKGLLICLKDTH